MVASLGFLVMVEELSEDILKLVMNSGCGTFPHSKNKPTKRILLYR